MLISNLQIQDFRNIQSLDVEFAPGINLVLGPNAQGKTNLLEAIYCLVTGRSFRTTDDRELMPWEQAHYETTIVRAKILRAAGEQNLVLAFNRKTKNIIAGGEPIRRLAQLIGQLNAVLFTPQDLDLVRGAPGRRRRFIDIALSQVSRSYIHHLQQYQAALKNRNALLKSPPAGASTSTAISVYDQLLATHGSQLILARYSALFEIAASSAKSYADIAGQSEILQVTYHPTVSLPSTHDTQVLAEKLLSQLTNARSDDQRRQITSVGPHRDDFAIAINNHLARDYGSQGQQRTAVLALKMAELEYLEKETGETPLLLLDDLLSELDESRRRALISRLHGRNQTFITATDNSSLDPQMPPGRTFNMLNGHLVEKA